MDTLVLEEPFRSLWKDKDPFAEVEKISGNTVRALETRRTLRFEVDGKGFYLKLHHGTEFSEVIKNLIRLRLPVLGADREWNAIHRLAEHGVDTMVGVAYGEQGGNPLTKTSFIITEELESAVSLRHYWLNYLKSVRVKRLLINRVADMVRGMHACGINHRDCYIVHFLIRLPFDGENGQDEDLKISLIDLHRAMLRDAVPVRWRNKDLIELLFSVRELDFGIRNIYRFMKRYFQQPLRQILKNERALIGIAKRRLNQMLRHHNKRIKNK